MTPTSIIFIFQAGSSTLKSLLMQITERFTKYDIELYSREKKLQQLHGVINSIFKLPVHILQPKNPERILNTILDNRSILSFSFVRHPYTRYESCHDITGKCSLIILIYVDF